METKDDILNNETFYNWLYERNLLVKEYAGFLADLGLKSASIVELDKGIADSVCEKLSEFGYDVLAITDYCDTFRKINSRKNLIVIKNGIPFIGKKEVKTIITQLPINQEKLDQLKKIASKQTEVVIGAYGNSLDHNKDENIRNLRLYESFLYLMGNIEIESKYVDNGVSYMGVVISRPKEYILDKYPLRKL